MSDDFDIDLDDFGDDDAGAKKDAPPPTEEVSEEGSNFEATMMEPSELPKSDDPLIDMVLGSCRLVSKLGEGGMGAVYKGHHEGLDIDVAMKILPKHLAEKNPDFIDRFRREARVAARLNHPNVVNVMNVGEEQGVHFIIMEFVKGIDLKEFIVKKGSLEIPEAVNLIKQVFQALEAGHVAGILHRDIKPANVFLKEDVPGEVPQAKLGDFGLAKIGESGQNADQGNTMSGMMMGTPHYISPEQAEDAKRVDARADIYSMGCMLYYMLAGKVPYDGESFVQIVLQHLQSPIPDVRDARQGVPDELAMAIMKMMTKNKDERFQSSTEVLKVLDKIERGLEGGPGMSEAEIATMAPTAAAFTPPAGAMTSTPTMAAGSGQVVCPACNQITSADGKWCENCGGSLLEQCRKCKDEVRVGRKFCPSCGYNQDESREIFSRIASAQSNIDEKRFAEALADADAILALEEDAPEALTFKETATAVVQEANGYKENAREAFHLRDYEGVEEFLQSAIEITPHDEALQQELSSLPDRIRERELGERLDAGREALANRGPRQALAAFQEALEFDDANEEAHLGIKNCEETIIRVAESKAAIETIPEESLREICDAWEKILALDAKDDDALQYYGVLSERLTSVEDHVDRATSLRRNKKWEDSIIEWQSALELWATCPEATVGLTVTEKLQEADSLLAEKRLPQVLELALAAVNNDPNCEDAIKLRDEIEDTLARIAAWKQRVDGMTDPDDFDTAVELLTEGTNLHPHDEELHSRLNDFKERVRLRDYERALEEARNAWESYLPRQAFQAFQTAMDLEPESEESKAGIDKCQAIIDEIRDLTAQAEQHEEKGELDKAIETLDEIIEKDPESQEAPKAHQALTQRMEKAKALIADAKVETETRDWGQALAKWEECLTYWGASAEALIGQESAAALLEEFEAQFAISKDLHNQKKLTQALAEHEKALEIGISDEALRLNDEMTAAHKQAEVLSDAGSGAIEQSHWREAAGKLEAAYELNIEAVDEKQLRQAQEQAKKVEKAIEESAALLKDGHFFKAEDTARKGLELGKDLKLEEIQERAKSHADEVREAIEIATAEEKSNPPKAVNLWHRVLELQPVNERAPEKIAQIESTINIAQQNFEEAQRFAGHKKWAAAIASGKDARDLNPAIPGIDEFLEQTASSHKTQKIIIAAVAAAVILVVSFIVIQSVIRVRNNQKFDHLMEAGTAGLKEGDWSTAKTSFTSAIEVFDRDEAKSLETIASRLEAADKELQKAKRATGKNAIAAFNAARKQIDSRDALLKSPAYEYIKSWMEAWTKAEHDALLAYTETLESPKEKVELWVEFLKNHKNSRFDKPVSARNKTLLVSYYSDEYNRIADQFDTNLITEKDAECEMQITALEKLLVEASSTKFPIPQYREIPVLRDTLKNAPLVREIKKAVQASKQEAKAVTSAADKIAIWKAFTRKYPGKELQAVSGELENEYNTIIQKFNTKLASNAFAEAAAVQQSAEVFNRERMAAKFAINITEGNRPDELTERLNTRKAALEKEAFTKAEEDSKGKAPTELIAIWNTFLQEYPKDVFGNHTEAAQKYSNDAHVADFTAHYKEHLATFQTKLKAEDFTASEVALKKAETLYDESKAGGYAIDLPATERPSNLRQTWVSTKNAFDLAKDYAAAKAKAAEQKESLQIATVWETFVNKHPLSNQAKDAKTAVTDAYKAAYNERLGTFNTAIGKKSEAGFKEAGDTLSAVTLVLKRATDGGYNLGLTAAQQPDALTRKLTEERGAWIEEQALKAATAESGTQIKAAKFDDALKTWEAFITKYPNGRYTEQGQQSLKATRTAAAEWHVAEGEKALAGNKLHDAFKKAGDALRYDATSTAAIGLQKQVMPRLVAAAGIFEIPTGNDDAGNPVRKGGDDATGYPLEIRHKSTGMHFVFAPAGVFTTEDNAATITISRPFYVGKYEVTRAQVGAFDQDTSHLSKAIAKKQKDSDEALRALGQPTVQVNAWNNPGYTQDDTHPAVRIAWNHTQDFFKWMNRSYSQPLFKLPTEAQWEYAARAGTTGDFFWGDDEDAYTDYSNARGRKTAPVGSKKPNSWGLYDVTGNVMEWCEDWHNETYFQGTLTDPTVTQPTGKRTCRGGAFSDRGKKLMISVRYGYSPDYDLRMGFRVAVDATTILSTTTVFAAGGR